MEALGLSDCQKHYTFMNGDTYSEHAITISGALKMVEKLIREKPDEHMDIIEKLRAQRRADASNTKIFSSTEIPSSSNLETNAPSFDVLPTPPQFSVVESFMCSITDTRVFQDTPTGSSGINSSDLNNPNMHASVSVVGEHVLTL